jgi:hypothetical protein
MIVMWGKMISHYSPIRVSEDPDASDAYTFNGVHQQMSFSQDPNALIWIRITDRGVSENLM